MKNQHSYTALTQLFQTAAVEHKGRLLLMRNWFGTGRETPQYVSNLLIKIRFSDKIESVQCPKVISIQRFHCAGVAYKFDCIVIKEVRQ